MDSIVGRTAGEIAREVREGRVTVREVVDAHFARVEQVNPRLNAVVQPRFAEARAEADAADERGEPLGPLHGVPVTIKDQFDVAGLATTFGVARLRGAVATVDDPLVAAWRRAGAIVLGKTNVPQTLGVIETDNPIWGRTNNPWDLARTPGGSSGGEAAILAAGGSALGLGSDLGGSLRIPAHCCGIVTLRPTGRRLSCGQPPVATAEGAEGLNGQPGAMGRTVADVALGLRVLVEANEARPTSLNAPVPWREAGELAGKRVAVLPQVGDWAPSPAVRRALDEAAAALRAAGVAVEAWPGTVDPAEGVAIFFQMVGASQFAFVRQILGGEAPNALMKKTAQLTTMPAVMAALLQRGLAAAGQKRVARMLSNTRARSASGLLDLLGERLRYEARFVGAMEAGGFDAVLLPVLPIPAFPHGESENLADFWGTALIGNVLGMPVGVVPVTRVRPGEESDRAESRDPSEGAARRCELGSAGLPVGVQVMARHWREDVALALMAAIEARVPAMGLAPG